MDDIPEIFRTNFTARLAADITATDTVLILSSVPDDAPAGTYRFRLGTDPRTSEWIAADYPGAGTTFTNAQRGNEGGTPAVAWFAGTPVSHTLTGKSFTALSTAVVTGQARANLAQYIRPPALRVYIASNFN